MMTNITARFFTGRKEKLTGSIILCAAASLSGTFYFYEHQYGEQVHIAVCMILTAVIAAVWLSCSAVSGRDGKPGFMVFAFLYWGAPYVYLLWYGTRDNLHDYNKWLAMLSKAAKAVLYRPFETAAEKLGTSSAALAAILLISSAAAYTVFAVIKFRCDASAHETQNDGNNNNDQL